MAIKLTSGQVRRLIREEMNTMEGIDEMSLQEKQDLEEGLFDRLKANVSGRVAGAGASLGNLGSRVAATGRGALAGAQLGGQDKEQVGVKGATTVDAAMVRALTAASSRLNGYLKTRTDLIADMQKMNFGQKDSEAKKWFIKVLNTTGSAQPALVKKLDDALAAAKKGSAKEMDFLFAGDGATGAPRDNAEPLDTVNAHGGVAGMAAGTRDAAANTNPPSGASGGAVKQAAESISRSVANRLFEMNQKQQRRARR